jgi:hypothetical protein
MKVGITGAGSLGTALGGRLGQAGHTLGVAAAIGGLVGIVSLAALRRFETRYRGRGELEVLFPSPQPLGIMSDRESAAPRGLGP